MSDPGLVAILGRLAAGAVLTRAQARTATDIVMEGRATPAQIGAFLMGLRVRGESPEEIAGAAESMRAHAVPVQSARRPLIDTCGTGGDGSGTFNISTASAFVVAGAGAAVAKHGNRSISSRCGSADVLEALGARIDLPANGVEACLESTGFGFLFAPRHHEAMKHAAGPRKELGLRTLFNLLGPLTNPARATHQVLGVYAPHLTEPMARVLSLLGSEGAMVVHGEGGIDELSLAGPTRVTEWRGETLHTFTVRPEDVGLVPAPLAALAGGDAARNAAIIRDVLAGKAGPRADVVSWNAGAALYTGGLAPTLREGVDMARKTIAAGHAEAALLAFVRFTGAWR